MLRKTINGITVMIPENKMVIHVKRANLSDKHFQSFDYCHPETFIKFKQFLEGIVDDGYMKKEDCYFLCPYCGNKIENTGDFFDGSDGVVLCPKCDKIFNYTIKTKMKIITE